MYPKWNVPILSKIDNPQYVHSRKLASLRCPGEAVLESMKRVQTRTDAVEPVFLCIPSTLISGPHSPSAPFPTYRLAVFSGSEREASVETILEKDIRNILARKVPYERRTNVIPFSKEIAEIIPNWKSVILYRQAVGGIKIFVKVDCREAL